MKRHLTEEELIQQRFELAAGEQAAEQAEHLAGCAECRQRLELLGQKFASLDLLAEEMPVSEELISQTIAQAQRPVSRRVVSFGKYHWLGTAAAVLVIGFVWMMNEFGEQGVRRENLVEEQKSEEPAAYRKSPAPPLAEQERQSGLVAGDFDKEKGQRLEEGLLSRRSSSRPVDSPGIAAPAERGAKVDQYALAPTARGRGPAPDAAGAEPVTTPTVGREVALLDAPESATPLAAGVGQKLVDATRYEEPPFAPASAIELVTLPRRDNVQLTIYNSADLTLVRERRNLTLKQGWNWLQLMWANTLIDPTSLSLEPAAHGDKIDVQQLVFPARLRELGRWLIRSEISGQVPFEITYFTSGLTWRAFLAGVLHGDALAGRKDDAIAGVRPSRQQQRGRLRERPDATARGQSQCARQDS
ncbi:MAG: anti-sigma factor [Planctomycetota bacterium]|jgi:hypothetical protein